MSSTFSSPNISFGTTTKPSLPLQEIGELDELIDFDFANPETFRKLKRGKKSNSQKNTSPRRKRFDSSEYFLDQEMSSALTSPDFFSNDLKGSVLIDQDAKPSIRG